MSAVHFYLSVFIPSKQNLSLPWKKEDKKDTTINSICSKITIFGKIAWFNAFMEQNWLGLSFWAALNMLLVLK